MKNSFTIAGVCMLILAWSSTFSQEKNKYIGTVNLMSLPEDKWHISVLADDDENRLPNTNQGNNISNLSEDEKSSLLRIKSTNKVTSSSSIRLGKSFSGSTLDASQPADNGTSVSNGKFIVHTINNYISIFDTSGTNLKAAVSIGTFFNTSASISDPRAIYDAYNDRFIFLVTASPNTILLAFTQTNDPTGKWNKYSVSENTTGNTNVILDQPSVMVNENELAICGGMYDASSFAYLDLKIIQIRKKDGYNGTTSLLMKTWDNITNSDGGGADVCAAVNFGQQGDPYGNRIFLIQTNVIGNNHSKIYYYEITDSINGNPLMNAYGVKTNAFTLPAASSQKICSSCTNAKLQSNDNRILGAILLNGAIHFTYQTADPTSGFNDIVYSRLNLANNTLNTSIFASDTVNYDFPSLASFASSKTDSTVVICYLESNANIYPSIGAVLCDNNMNWSNPVLVVAGSSSIGSITSPAGELRWGDYTSCVRAHNASSPTVWLSGEYGYLFHPGQSNWIAQIISGINTSVNTITENKFSSVVYPNPVMDFYTIGIDLEKSAILNISIFNSEGKLVKELLNGWVSAGNTHLSFNRNALSSGMYFIKMSSEDTVLKTEKLIIE